MLKAQRKKAKKQAQQEKQKKKQEEERANKEEEEERERFLKLTDREKVCQYLFNLFFNILSRATKGKVTPD